LETIAPKDVGLRYLGMATMENGSLTTGAVPPVSLTRSRTASLAIAGTFQAKPGTFHCAISTVSGWLSVIVIHSPPSPEYSKVMRSMLPVLK
jgi:hypothetical protein